MKNVLGFLLFFSIVPVLAQVSAVSDRTDSAMAATQQNDGLIHDANGRIDYIVELQTETPQVYSKQLTVASRFAAFHKPQVVNTVLDFEGYYGFQAYSITSWTVPSFSAFLDESTANRLRADPRVKLVEPNRSVHFSIQSLPDQGAIWSDSVGAEIQPWGKIAVNPSSVTSNQTALVYVLDAGTAIHEDLNVVEWANPFHSTLNCGTRSGIPACTTPMSSYLVGCYTHGTATAGVIGAKTNGKGTQGINPGVKIISVVATSSSDVSQGCINDLDGSLTGTSEGQALDWIASDISANSPSYTSVVNMSLNPTSNMQFAWDQISALASQTAGHGAFVAQSAGNDYENACSHAYSNGSGAASSNDGIMVVGAINNHGQPVIPYLPGPIGFWKNSGEFGYDVGSNYGPCVDTWAPGDGIYLPAANPTIYTNQLANPPGGTYTTYGFGSGTSFSAPHVAGLASLLIEQGHLTSPAAVEQAVRSKFHPLGSTDTCKGTCSIAIAIPSMTAPPSPASKTYGELILQTKDSTGTSNQSVNGFPFIPCTQTSCPNHDYEENQPSTINAYYGMSVNFQSTGTAGCTVTRTSGSTQVTIVNGGSSFSSPVTQAWNEGSDAASSTWNIVSTCFPSVAAVTSFTPNFVLTNAPSGAFTSGQTSSYSLIVKNVGYKTAGTVTVTDTLPSQLAVTTINAPGWSCTTSPIKCTRSDSLATGASYPTITINVNVQAMPAGTVTNTATVSGGSVVTPITTSAVTTIVAPDLTITKTHSGNFIQGQIGARYSLSVSNVGSAPSSGVVTVTDTLPSGLTATAISGVSGWSCSTPPTLSCTRSDALAVNASYPAITVTVNVASNAPSSVTNTASVSGGGDQTPGNNTATDVTAVIAPDLSISMTHIGDFAPGETGAQYTITTQIVGGGSTSGTTIVTFVPPSNGYIVPTAISPPAGSGWSCTQPTSCSTTNALAPGSSYTFTETVNVTSGAALGTYASSATVSNPSDVTPSDNTASDQTTIYAPVDLSAQVIPGASGSGIVTVRSSNLSSQPAQAAFVQVVIQGNSCIASSTSDNTCTLLSVTGGGGELQCTGTTTATYQCSLGALAANSQTDRLWSLGITSQNWHGGTATVSATVSATSYDPVQSNNSASGTLFVTSGGGGP
jgi:uncharacterized repeat protein (TIGR01451 family)